jgi:hypothetical protein
VAKGKYPAWSIPTIKHMYECMYVSVSITDLNQAEVFIIGESFGAQTVEWTQ